MSAIRVPPEDRARSLGWLSAGTNVGTMLGPVIGSFATYWGQQWPGILAACLCFINALFAWKWLPESKQPHAQVAQRKPVWHGVWSVLRNPTGRGAAADPDLCSRDAGVFMPVFGAGAVSQRGVRDHRKDHRICLSLCRRFFRFDALGVDRPDRRPNRRAMVDSCGAAILVLGLLAYPLAPNLWSLAFIVPLVPIGTSLLFPATTAMMSRYSPKGRTRD